MLSLLGLLGDAPSLFNQRRSDPRTNIKRYLARFTSSLASLRRLAGRNIGWRLQVEGTPRLVPR